MVIDLKFIIKKIIILIIFFLNIKKKINLKKNLQINIFGNKFFHFFCGYYDLDPINSEEKYLLFIKVRNNDEKNKSADICYIDINDKDQKINFLAETNCWSWQLGTRLTWSKKNVEEFYFNFFCETRRNFCTVQHNIKTNQANHFYGSFYDIHPSENFKLTLNFNRLEFFRPGYGFKRFYLNICDKNNYNKNLKDDGIFISELKKNSHEKILISIFDIANFKSKDSNLECSTVPHYFNHISFSPSGNNFIFYDCFEIKKKRFTRVFISNLKGEFKLIENLVYISHYLWLDDQRVLFFCKPSHKLHTGYYIYILDEKIFQYQHYMPHRDGHPSLKTANEIIIDTYPDSLFFRNLFLSNIKEKKTIKLGSFFTHKAGLNGKNKCDLHPKVSFQKNYICIDLQKKNLREIGLITLNEKKI
jgi:hypothetical protein